MQVGVLVGPAIGGLLLAASGIAWAYGVDVAGSRSPPRCSSRCAPTRRARNRRRAEPGRHRPRGSATRWAGRDLLGTYLVDIAAMLLAMPVVLFPALARTSSTSRELLGLLYSAETVGALLATATSGWTARVHHHGRAIVVAAAA